MNPLPTQPRIAVPKRIGAGLLAAALLILLVVSSTLRPALAGHATHLQLGLPRCGWAMATGKPCPTCGMTTAFAWAAHGHPWMSFITQPAGALLALLAAAGFWLALHVAITGSNIGWMMNTLLRPRSVWIGFIIGLLAWVYKLAVWRQDA